MADTTPQGVPQDRYVVQEYLSEGGMGAIYIGKKMGAGGFAKQVVLKQLLPEFTRQQEFRDLFLREARLSATLDHANIVHTIDLVNADNDFFIVMEYVPGADLRTLLKKAKRRQRRFSPAAGIYVTRELLSALSYAHNKRSLDGQPLNLIHRDVSPSNILISSNGEVKLTDFGIAKASTHNSVLYRVKGKMGYMSPEQAKSESMDHRSDLYSLAVCLYEMVAGERLFVKAGLSTSADEMYSQPVPLLSRHRNDIPPEFDKVMLKALAVDPRHRYQSASAFQDALLRCAHRAGLMMSTPELAAHLLEVCGESENWRNQDDDDEVMDAERPGTEVYESEDGTGLLGPDERSDLDLVSMVVQDDQTVSGTLINERERREKRSRTSMFALDRLRNMELTSLIDLTKQRPEGAAQRRPSGSQPLVDIDDFGRGLDPGAVPGPHGAGPDAALRSLEEELEPLPHQAHAPYPAGHGHWSGVSSPVSGNTGNVGGNVPSRVAGGHAALHPAHAPAADVTVEPTSRKTRKRKRRISPLVFILVLVAVLIIGVSAAVLIGLSGPEMGEGQDPTETPSTGNSTDDERSGVDEESGTRADEEDENGP